MVEMKPEKAALHTASAVLHILRLCRKMLHTPSGVLHKNEAFSDEALFRFTPQYEASPLPFRYEAFASLIWCKNEKWEFRFAILHHRYYINQRILNNSCTQIRLMPIKPINTEKGDERWNHTDFSLIYCYYPWFWHLLLR